MNTRSRTLGWLTLFLAISPLHAANTTVSFDRPYHLQLACCVYNATESDGTVAVTVVRTGDISASFTVELATAIIGSAGFDYPDLVAAVPGLDFVPQDLVLTFAAGETSKVVNVPLLDNGTANRQNRLLRHPTEKRFR